MEHRISEQVQEAVKAALRRAADAGHPEIEPPHLLLALLDDEDLRALLASAGIDAAALRYGADALLARLPVASGASVSPPRLSAVLTRAVGAASKDAGGDAVSAAHLLVALAAAGDPVGRLLRAEDVTRHRLLVAGTHQAAVRSPYARDLTVAAFEGRIDPPLGLAAESRRLIEILSRREGGNALLVGERGVGKSALVAGLALRLAGLDVPAALRGARLVALDLTPMPDGELDRIVSAAERRGGVLFVLEDLDAAARPGSAVPAVLGRLTVPGAPRVIATTTPAGERDRLADLPALRGNFQRLPVPEASAADTTMILRHLRTRFEEHHRIAIRDAALVAAARLANRLEGRFLPGGAVELLDEAATRLQVGASDAPAELRELERRVTRLEIERFALLKEDDEASRARLAEVERDLAGLRRDEGALRHRWSRARNDRDRAAELRRRVEDVREEAERAQRDGDLETAARLLYGELPDLEQRLAEAVERTEAAGMPDRVALREGDVAAVVADALDVPVEEVTGAEPGPLGAAARLLRPRPVPAFQDVRHDKAPPEPEAEEAGVHTGMPLGPADPRTLGGYRLLRRLGQGGQGVVYLAEDPGGRRVAVKVLHAVALEHSKARERFLREIDAARRVASFCTAQVLDADFAGELPYVVSEYVTGPSLRRAVAEDGTRSGGALDRLAIGTITALAAIAEAGIVHRDFKPDNVLLGPDGPRVIDFGIARITDAGSSVTGQAIGTPAYMAPEQFEGGRIGPAADVYAWACTMVHAATGRPPHGADSIPQIMYRKLRGEADLGDFPARASGTLRALVGEGLRTAPGERPAARDVLLRLIGQDAPAPTRLLAEGAARATGTP
ncbi:protein kinase domain-containing protein [Actinomadura violacea]|uniref:Protein kinase n=1 Tax=Actinomadura violacea TaxID=2819934 RepID=A0ABS3S9V5_9ACTN|nr:protein kinase [Actinomadura violacea]MBO2465791.1 protein kinase [Actinomadura violacea]